MEPTVEERETLFKNFGRALFSRDIEALYRTVTPSFVWNYHDGIGVTKHLVNRLAVATHLEEQKATYSEQRFHNVGFSHLADATFMTFHVTETLRSTGEVRRQSGIERYTFENGRIALKDVYRKPLDSD